MPLQNESWHLWVAAMVLIALAMRMGSRPQPNPAHHIGVSRPWAATLFCLKRGRLRRRKPALHNSGNTPSWRGLAGGCPGSRIASSLELNVATWLTVPESDARTNKCGAPLIVRDDLMSRGEVGNLDRCASAERAPATRHSVGTRHKFLVLRPACHESSAKFLAIALHHEPSPCRW